MNYHQLAITFFILIGLNGGKLQLTQPLDDNDDADDFSGDNVPESDIIDIDCEIGFAVQLLDSDGNVFSKDAPNIPFNSNLTLKVALEDSADLYNLTYKLMINGQDEQFFDPLNSTRLDRGYNQFLVEVIAQTLCDDQPQTCRGLVSVTFNIYSDGQQVSTTPDSMDDDKSNDAEYVKQGTGRVCNHKHSNNTVIWFFVIVGSITAFGFLAFALYNHRVAISGYLRFTNVDCHVDDEPAEGHWNSEMEWATYRDSSSISSSEVVTLHFKGSSSNGTRRYEAIGKLKQSVATNSYQAQLE